MYEWGALHVKRLYDDNDDNNNNIIIIWGGHGVP